MNEHGFVMRLGIARADITGWLVQSIYSLLFPNS
jgi:hypothetical protein